MRVVLAHEAWVWGIGFDKDDSWETPPARAPASTQLIVLRVWVRSLYLTGGRPNLWVPHLSSLRQSPTPTPASEIFSVCLMAIIRSAGSTYDSHQYFSSHLTTSDIREHLDCRNQIQRQYQYKKPPARWPAVTFTMLCDTSWGKR